MILERHNDKSTAVFRIRAVDNALSVGRPARETAARLAIGEGMKFGAIRTDERQLRRAPAEKELSFSQIPICLIRGELKVFGFPTNLSDIGYFGSDAGLLSRPCVRSDGGACSSAPTPTLM
jgi:hypothetical protein